ncbi:MAG TPA: hypothetical protein VHN79_13225 [Lacunisphaera sp.]|nr:hypothetical protein [Lacunisphaera sp.]
MDADVEYFSRHDVLEKARTIRLTGEGVSVEATGAAAFVLPYANITEVRLRFSPTRVQTNRFECLVLTRGLGLKFSNEFYEGIASFSDRSAEYREFVAALCRRVAVGNPGVRFAAGRDLGMLVLEYGFLALMMLFLGWILWLTNGPLRWVVWVKLAIVVFFLPTLLRYVRRSLPVRFDPNAIPATVLPAAAQRGQASGV